MRIGVRTVCFLGKFDVFCFLETRFEIRCSVLLLPTISQRSGCSADENGVSAEAIMVHKSKKKRKIRLRVSVL